MRCVILSLATIVTAAVTAATATASRSAECPSFEKVVGFTGTLTLTAGAVASGQSGPSGTTTIQLGHVLNQIRFQVGNKRHVGRYYTFGGLHGLHASGGKVLVDDYLKDTGPADVEGELTYNRSAAGQSFLGGLGIDRDHCEYRLGVAAMVAAAYKGSADADLGHLVSVAAWSADAPVPHDLTTSWVGTQTFPTHADCPDIVYHIHESVGCAAVNSAWLPQLIELLECGSTDINAVDPSGACLNDTNPDLKTPAHLSWTLKPILAKG